MKKVMVLAVLFLSTVSMLSSQTYASINNPYIDVTEPSLKDKVEKTKSPKKPISPIFITGSEFQSELTGLKLMPTPAKEKVELLIQSRVEKDYQVELYDQEGNQLRKYEVSSNDPKTISVNEYTAGSYYFLIYIPDGSIKKKFKIVD